MSDAAWGLFVSGLGFVGIAAAALINLGRDALHRKNERMGIAAAFLGEISGMRQVIERRHYREYAAERFRANELPIIAVHERPDRLFSQNAGLLRYLPPNVSEDLGRHYSILNAILEDLRSFAESGWPEDDRQRIGAEFMGLLDEMIALEDRLIPRLRKIAEGW